MSEEQKQTTLDKTTLYLENYREMQRYVENAISEASQIEDATKYNISAENAYLQTVRECRTETIILLEHINKAMELLKEEATNQGEKYKYDAFEAVYIHGKTYEDVAKELECGRNSPKRWCRIMMARLSVKLFGVKAFEDDDVVLKRWLKMTDR